MLENTFRTPRDGVVFHPDTGKLYVYQPSTIEVMVAWPKPAAWKKTRGRPYWVHFRPEITIPRGDLERRIALRDPDADEKGQLWLPCCRPIRHRDPVVQAELRHLRWFATIPREVRELIAPFPDRHWHLLSLIARCGPAARDLVVSNPALAYALASNWVFHKPAVRRPLRSARALLAPGRKQREILGWLGFPATEWARRLLRKIPVSSVGILRLLYLRDSLADAAVHKLLSHLPRINAGVIRIVTDPALRRHATPRLLEEVAHDPHEDRRPRAAFLLRDCLAMHRGPARFPALRSLARLREVHDSLAEELWGEARSLRNVAFPPPPLEGTPNIVPITDLWELEEEGRIQRNCVASYAHRILASRKVYIYRVLAPERCTLSVARRGDRWVLSEIRSACNRPASPETIRVVQEWIRRASAPRPLRPTADSTTANPSPVAVPT
jgi:hypothetical protein